MGTITGSKRKRQGAGRHEVKKETQVSCRLTEQVAGNEGGKNRAEADPNIQVLRRNA